MRHTVFTATATVALASFVSLTAEEQATIVVTAPVNSFDGVNSSAGLGAGSPRAQQPDTARWLRSLPGADVSSNGPLTGIHIYRGLAAYRVGVAIDGCRVASGCPNLMDPPLSYLPEPLLDELKVRRGVAPVSDGIATFGGQILASTWTAPYGETDDWTSHGRVQLGAVSVSSGFNGGAVVAVTNRRHRLSAELALADGDDYDAGDTSVEPTSYATVHAGLAYSWRIGDDHEAGVTWRRTDTDETGTPALPMDIVLVESDRIGFDYDGQIGEHWDVEVQAQYLHNDHVMNNYALRQAPADPMRWRDNTIEAESVDFNVEVSHFDETFGIDIHHEVHDSVITNPNNAMFRVGNLNEAESLELSAFAEWEGQMARDWELGVGLRITMVSMDAGDVTAPMMAGPQTLAARFNSADRSQDDVNVEVDARASWLISESVTVLFGGARKVRSPTYLERYGWLPMPASAGLADGNTYVGRIDLDPEVNYQLDIGLRYDHEDGYFEPHVFYQRIDGYIQGVPTTDMTTVMVSTANGDPTPLQWANVDAVLYGFDLAGGWQLQPQWRIDGVVSYVRGERDDIDDDLYRIPPLHGDLSLGWARAAWSAGIQLQAAAEQSAVSASNSEAETDGWALVNLSGSYTCSGGTLIEAGIANIFDSEVDDHLAGYNRAMGTEVGVGERLPMPGINAWLKVTHTW